MVTPSSTINSKERQNGGAPLRTTIPTIAAISKRRAFSTTWHRTSTLAPPK
jgi:hypothetical protein